MLAVVVVAVRVVKYTFCGQFVIVIVAVVVVVVVGSTGSEGVDTFVDTNDPHNIPSASETIQNMQNKGALFV